MEGWNLVQEPWVPRSILVNAKNKSINDYLNKRLERTEFMPFAPVTPIDYASECYLNWREDQVAHLTL